MDQQIEKLIDSAGGHGKYQISLLVISFLIWTCLNLHNTSLPILEKVPIVTHLDEDGNSVTEPLNYDICEKGNFTISENYPYSWVIDMNIYCDRDKVGLIGSFTYAGLTIGCLLYSVMDKFLSPKNIIILGIGLYAGSLCSTCLISYFPFKLIILLLLGIGNGLGLFTSLGLMSESVSSKFRSIFNSILDMGLDFCAILFAPLFPIFNSYKYVFWLQNIIAFSTLLLFAIIGNNSPRYYFSKEKPEEAIETLKQIAVFNGKLDNFITVFEESRSEIILKEKESRETGELKPKKNQKFGYSALIKYPSLRYTFLVFTFMFVSTTLILNSVLINAKVMEGETEVIVVVLYAGDIISAFSAAFVINSPLGRKKSLIMYYGTMSFGFVLFVTLSWLEASAIYQLLAMIIIRSCLSSVFSVFYTYCLESYPTPIRSLGFGLHSMSGNLAGIISPMIIEHFEANFLYIIFAVLAAFNCFLGFFLKETAGKPMQETIEELNLATVDEEQLVPDGRETINERIAREKKENTIIVENVEDIEKNVEKKNVLTKNEKVNFNDEENGNNSTKDISKEDQESGSSDNKGSNEENKEVEDKENKQELKVEEDSVQKEPYNIN